MTIDLAVLGAGAFLVLMALIWKAYRAIDERLSEIQADIGELHNGVSQLFFDLLQIEWVKWSGFSQVECDSKGFFVNVTVTSSRHVCAHAKIDQDEAPER